jgi:hypothetical protein
MCNKNTRIILKFEKESNEKSYWEEIEVNEKDLYYPHEIVFYLKQEWLN